MPQRGFSTSYWTDPFIMKLPQEAKLRYAYLWTNIHCNQAGLYEIALESIAFETALPLEDVPRLIRMLEPKVAWYPDANLIWVKNFLRHQTKSPKFLAAAAKCLSSIHNNGLVKEFLDFNQQHNVLIPYQYPKATVAIPDSGTDTHTTAATHTKSSSGSDKGGGEGTPAPEKISTEVEDKELAVISQLYEANIGMLTPVVAERLRDVRARYPPGWFGEALKEAVASEHRNLKYIEAILERWKTEGFKSRTKGGKEKRYARDGEHRQHTESDGKPYEWEETPDEPDDTS